MRARLLVLVLVLVASATPAGLAQERESRADLWRAFEAALTLDERRTIVRRLSRWTERERMQSLLLWLGRSSSDPQAVALLARAMLDAVPQRAERRLIGVLDDPELVTSRRPILRVLADGPREQRLRRNPFGRIPLSDSVAVALASFLVGDTANTPVASEGRMYLSLLRAVEIATSGGGQDAWRRLGEALAVSPVLSVELWTEILDRALGLLDTPTPADLLTWPKEGLDGLAEAGVTTALGALLAKADPRRLRKLLHRIVRERLPSSVEVLVDALIRVEAHSAAFYRIHATLVDLTGAAVPPDPDLWRSWIAGHRSELESIARLPPTATIEAAVQSGIAFLLERQNEDGSFAYDLDPGRKGTRQRGEQLGATALVLYALAKSGVPKDAEPIQRAVAYLLRYRDVTDFQSLRVYNYAASIAVMALQSLGRRWKNELAEIAVALVGGQMSSGGWTYHLPRGTQVQRDRGIDLSNTQYAVLGLRAAAFAKVPVDASVWEGVLRLMREAEDGDTGEWNYLVPGNQIRSGMSAIAAASMLIARSRLEKDLRLADVLADAQIVRALRSMARKYGRPNVYDGLDHYTLYSIERVGALFGVYSFDGVPWYDEGAKALLERQHDDGGWGEVGEEVRWWSSWGRNVDTAYALLFFRRATTPVFSAGLDVPSNPDLPIRRVQPRRTEAIRPPLTIPDPTVVPVDREAEAALRTQVARIRSSCVEALRGVASDLERPADRLVVWRALAALDPLDIEAHLMAGMVLSQAGAWKFDAVLGAALPFDRPTKPATARVQNILDRTAVKALGAAREGDRGETSRSLVEFALAIKKLAREVGTPRGW